MVVHWPYKCDTIKYQNRFLERALPVPAWVTACTRTSLRVHTALTVNGKSPSTCTGKRARAIEQKIYWYTRTMHVRHQLGKGSSCRHVRTMRTGTIESPW
jgi:hypothetical protein